ncbi:hypothetical protein H0H87_006301, partial [Tephrocybe sp. NHM501043]
MPSFRTIFTVAATAFATLSSAAPIAGGVDQTAQLVGVSNIANEIAHVNVEGVDVSVLGTRDAPALPKELINGINKRQDPGDLDSLVGDLLADIHLRDEAPVQPALPKEVTDLLNGLGK